MPARYDPGPPGRGAEDRFGIPNPRESGSVVGADRRRSGPSCVLPKGVPQGRTESGGGRGHAYFYFTTATLSLKKKS